MKSQFVKWALLIIIAAWFSVSVIVLFGEENPNYPLTLFQFMFLKMGALASVVATGWLHSKLQEKGYLPNVSRLNDEED